MPAFPLRGALSLILLGGVSLALAPAGETIQSWSSPLLGRELVIIEKTVPGDEDLVEPQPVPSAVRARLGVDFVEYEAFVAAVLPEADAKTLTTTALAENRGVLEDPRAPITLTFHTFDPAKPGDRTAPWDFSPFRPKPVPDLVLLRFAFPLLDEWTEGSAGLPGCGVHPLVYYGDGTFLAAAKNLEDVINCPVSRYISWAGSFLTTDRISPEILEKADLYEMKPYSLTFVPGTSLQMALGELPLAMVPGESMTWEGGGSLTLAVQATRPELEALLTTSPHLLSIFEAEGEPEPSDERQGLICAGKYEGYSSGAVSGAVTGPGTYLSWLASRNLRTAGGHPIVAVFDTGFDDGSGVGGSHHPDLAGKLLAEGNYVFNRDTPALEDLRGHGTMVTGIITGIGTAAGTKDRQGYFLGTGIAPDVKLVAVQVMDSGAPPVCRPKTGFGDPPDNIGAAIAFARSNGAVIGNHSWNLGRTNYDSMAQLFDRRVIDAVDVPENGPLEPMTMVAAAGNAGQNLTLSTIQSPATAKNVITVGATQSYRPSSQDQAPPNACLNPTLNTDLFTREANNIGEVSAFSSRGTPFTPLGQPGVRLHTVRIKPDLVAPGGRVVSTIPYDSPYYTCPALCRPSWPAGQYYSISSGTSFAAPVVSGVAALAIKWFRNQSPTLVPSPSLIKAALIATARDLGLAPGQDHRPSRDFGWGRVDLARLTDPLVKRFFVTDDDTPGVATGQERMWRRTIDQPGKDTLIVLAWSDPPSEADSGPGPLVNDLRLKVELVGTTASWWGNNFRENIVGDDNGYSYRYNATNPGKSDITNTVEAVFIPANTFTAGQKLNIKIQGKSVRPGSQKFAVYAYNLQYLQ